MKDFANLLNDLYFTYSHLEKFKLLKNYFATTRDPERGYALAVIANTCQFPTFKHSLIKELIQTRIDPYLFHLSYDYVGDLSETVALLWSAKENGTLPPLSKLITDFNTISPKELTSYLQDLLDKSSLIERWALLKLGTGNLRIGVSSRFIKKVLAHIGNISVSDIEKIWHGLTPPYIELFAWLEDKLLPIKLDTIFFHPVMLSHPLKETDLPSITPELFSVEPKFDGIRVQFVVGKEKKALFSRTGELINDSFPELLPVVDSPIILDGELVVGNEKEIGSFNDLQKRLNRKKPDAKLLKNHPAAIILYDVLQIKDKALDSLPFLKRREELEKWYNQYRPNNMWLSPIIPFSSYQSLETIKKETLEDKAIEGLMIKRNDSPYIPGRPKGHWFKWKRNPYLIDTVLMYAQRGSGKRSSLYSDYTFGLWQEDKLLPIGKAYFGFTNEELKQLDKWIRFHIQNRFGPVVEVKKELVFEVAFDSLNYSTRHKSGIALRFPRINRIRWDKPASEADVLSTLFAILDS